MRELIGRDYRLLVINSDSFILEVQSLLLFKHLIENQVLLEEKQGIVFFYLFYFLLESMHFHSLQVIFLLQNASSLIDFIKRSHFLGSLSDSFFSQEHCQSGEHVFRLIVNPALSVFH